MIYINILKFIDLFKIVGAAFLLAFAGNYFFGWDFNTGLFVGLLLGIWESIFEKIEGHVLIPEQAVNIKDVSELEEDEVNKDD